MNKKCSVIVIVGPTASGKSDLGVMLAKKFQGEIVSADSRQIYRDLDIGTAKVKGIWKKGVYIHNGIFHYCIDIVSPKKTYTASEFKTCARDAITKITSHGNLPIIVGGTAFWIDTLIYDLDLPEVAPNPALRKQLEKKSVAQLLTMLNKLDVLRAAAIEQKNPRRLVRAIEIASALGAIPSISKKNPYRALWIGIAPDQKILKQRIARRSRQIVHSGLIAETEKLLSKGVSKKRIYELGFEYVAALHVIERKNAGSDLSEELTRQTMKYAVRQMRWFKRNKDIHWVRTPTQAERLVKNYLRSSR